jgi:hypothetical protein
MIFNFTGDHWKRNFHLVRVLMVDERPMIVDDLPSIIALEVYLRAVPRRLGGDAAIGGKGR